MILCDGSFHAAVDRRGQRSDCDVYTDHCYKTEAEQNEDAVVHAGTTIDKNNDDEVVVFQM